jgi:hypothetical protein
MGCLCELHIYLSIMGGLSTGEIVTVLSTIPGLLMSCLSAWFAYLALQRRHVARNDIETATIEFIITQFSTTRSRYEYYFPPTVFCLYLIHPQP